jgi:integrase
MNRKSEPLNYAHLESAAEALFNKQKEKSKNAYMVDLISRYVLLGLNTGLRFSDVVKLDLTNFKLANNGNSSYYHCTVILTKTKESVKVRIPINTYTLLLDNALYWSIEKKPFVNLFDKKNKLITMMSIERLLKKYFSQLDENITSHSVRKTAAYRLYKQSGNLAYCQKLLGHKKLQSTFLYLDTTEIDYEDYYASTL